MYVRVCVVRDDARLAGGDSDDAHSLARHEPASTAHLKHSTASLARSIAWGRNGPPGMGRHSGGEAAEILQTWDADPGKLELEQAGRKSWCR